MDYKDFTLQELAKAIQIASDEKDGAIKILSAAKVTIASAEKSLVEMGIEMVRRNRKTGSEESKLKAKWPDGVARIHNEGTNHVPN